MHKYSKVLCRNSRDGLHHPGPCDYKGRYFCIHCGHPLYLYTPRRCDDEDKTREFVIGMFVLVFVTLIVGIGAYRYFWG
jgi:hypothetical protein